MKFGNFVIIDLKSNIKWDLTRQMFQVPCTLSKAFSIRRLDKCYLCIIGEGKPIFIIIINKDCIGIMLKYLDISTHTTNLMLHIIYLFR